MLQVESPTIAGINELPQCLSGSGLARITLKVGVKERVNMSSKKSTVFSVAVTPDIRHAFASLDIRGKGGFQSLMRDVAARVTSGAGVVRFDATDFERITKYATLYGEGGFQQRLRLLVSSWTAQHVKMLARS